MNNVTADRVQPTSPWLALESIPGLCAVPALWRALLADHFAAFKSAFLLSRPDLPARSVPCPGGCGISHEVVQHGPDDIVAVCRCESSICQDVRLGPADIIPLELSWTRLGGALCRALGCHSKPAFLGPPATWQIGSWSADAVPVILTLQTSRSEFRHVLGSLAARLRRPFILLAPTNQHLDALGTELLSCAKASCFTLETSVRLTAQGRLQALVTPGQLFGAFSPQPKDIEQGVAQRAFALVRQLDSEQPRKAPSVLTVFRLYCIEALSLRQIALRFGWSRTTIQRRLELIGTKTGVNPVHLRTLSPHLGRVENDVSEPRARHIQRRRLIYDEDPEAEQP